MKHLHPLQIARKCVGMRVLRKNKDKKILLRWKNIRKGAKEIEYAAKKQHCAKNAEFQRKAGQARPGVVRLAEYFVAAPPGRRATRHALVILCGRQKIPSPWQGRENESEGRSCTQARRARPGVVRLAEYSMAAPPRDAAYRLCAASASSVSAGNAGAAQREYAYPPSVQSARAY